MLVEVFKVGSHTAKNGSTNDFTIETLEQIKRNYNKRVHSNKANMAPLVKGHPKSNEPALGWVAKLFRRNDTLHADIINIDVELANEIKEERFKNFSIAINEDLSLRHIGIIGAVPPAVKDLNKEGISYFEDSDTFNEFYEDTDEVEHKFDEEAFDREITALLQSKEQLTNENQKLMEINEKLELQLKQHLQDQLQQERILQFTQNAKSINNITPAQQAKLTNILAQCHASSGEDMSNTILSFIREITKNPNTSTLTNPMEFTEPTPKFNYSGTLSERKQLHNSIENYIATHPETSYEDALSIILNQ